jgi:hypothetical protein
VVAWFLELHHPAFVKWALVHEPVRLCELAVSLHNLTGDGRVHIADGLDALPAADRVALCDRLADLEQF